MEAADVFLDEVDLCGGDVKESFVGEFECEVFLS